MRPYETTYIIDGSVNDADKEALILRYQSLLESKGAEFTQVVRWGKRQLAYEIKKQTRGYYVIFYYDADPSIIIDYHREMDLNEQILRYMTLISDGPHPDYIRDEGKPSGVTASKTPAVAPAPGVDTPVDNATEEVAEETVEVTATEETATEEAVTEEAVTEEAEAVVAEDKTEAETDADAGSDSDSDKAVDAEETDQDKETE